MANNISYKILDDDNVSKFVFTSEDAVYEAVIYKYGSYNERTVICCSIQSGCKVGCRFCGTGRNFVRNLTHNEIVEQVAIVLKERAFAEITSADEIKKFQIMFMSMGEPMDNFDEVQTAVRELNGLYPNAQLLISTVGLKNKKVLDKLAKLSVCIDKVGLQFSIHKANEAERNMLIPYKRKLSLREIRDYGMIWHSLTNRPVYLNYCIDGTNTRASDLNRLKDLFSPSTFYFTFSVICSLNKDNKLEGKYDDMEHINKIATSFVQDGYNVRVFDPAGQDTIGGGCGQLWFVQDWFKQHRENLKSKKGAHNGK